MTGFGLAVLKTGCYDAFKRAMKDAKKIFCSLFRAHKYGSGFLKPDSRLRDELSSVRNFPVYYRFTTQYEISRRERNLLQTGGIMKRKEEQQFKPQRFTNKFMFAKVMEDKKLCKKVLECLLGQPVGELKEVISEHQMCQTEDGKMIRVDIYTEDDKAIFDIEMQNLNKKSPQSLELPKRSRFYQSEIDVDFLNRGSSFKALPENNVIFICTFDPFGRGKAVYQFENRSDEIPPEPLNDGTRKYFFNCTYEGSDIPEELIHFYEFVRTGRAEDILTEDLNHAVEEKNMAIIYRSDYLRMREMQEDARDEGREEGREEGRKEGREEERLNTEREKARADKEKARADSLQEELDRLKKQIQNV